MIRVQPSHTAAQLRHTKSELVTFSAHHPELPRSHHLTSDSLGFTLAGMRALDPMAFTFAIIRTQMTSLLATDPFPCNSVVSCRATDWIRDVRREGEEVPVQFEESNLICTRPDLVPRDVDMVDDLVAIYRIRARVREHCVV